MTYVKTVNDKSDTIKELEKALSKETISDKAKKSIEEKLSVIKDDKPINK